MRSVVFVGIVLVIVTLAVYWQVGNHEFVNLDDHWFIADNAHVATGLTKDNILWAFTPVPEMGWFPVAWLSHMADVELYGLNPRGHHLTNVALHAAATLLLFSLLFRMTSAVWPSAFVATLFALHPAHVESVAWVAERRDVLSAFFGFLSLLIYVEYVAQRKTTLYLLSIGFFVLGLMSKSMLVTFPFVMLLLDFWPLNRYDHISASPKQQRFGVRLSAAALVKEKIPFFACALIAVVFTLKTPIMQELESIPLGLRFANAITAYLKYLGKLIWPAELGVFYPFPTAIPPWQVIGSLLVLLAVTVTVILIRRNHPYLATGWFWYLITLLPVLGLVQISTYAIADRYTYLPAVGLFIGCTWAVPAIFARHPYRAVSMALLATVVIVILTALTWQQLRHWQNSITLYRHALRVTPGNVLAHNNLGLSLAELGHLDEAIEEYRKVIVLKPDFAEAYNNLGLALAEKGFLDEAVWEYEKALALRPDYLEAYNNLGIAYKRKGDFNGAIRAYQKALEINPDTYQIYNNLGVLLQAIGLVDEAILQYQKAIALNPDYDDARYNLRIALDGRARAEKSP